MKKILNLVLLLTLAVASHAQRVLTLDSCRALALANNKELRMSQEKIKAAHYEQKAAFTNFLPKIDVAGTYMRTQKEISLDFNDAIKGDTHKLNSFLHWIDSMDTNSEVFKSMVENEVNLKTNLLMLQYGCRYFLS